MYDLETVRLLHRHGDEWVPMPETRPEAAHHDAADHDIERGLLKGGRVFRCVACDETVTVVPSSGTRAEGE